MNDSKKPVADFSETDAIETDDEGRLSVVMEMIAKVSVVLGLLRRVFNAGTQTKQ